MKYISAIAWQSFRYLSVIFDGLATVLCLVLGSLLLQEGSLVGLIYLLTAAFAALGFGHAVKCDASIKRSNAIIAKLRGNS